MLRRVYGALDRVLVAHVTCDPFVSTREGMSELVRWLRRNRGVDALGVATFSPTVRRAILRRFGWEDVLGAETDGPAGRTAADACAPLWPEILASIARSRLGSIAASEVAFVSDDAWELGYAVGAGCGRAIHVDPSSSGRHHDDQLDALGIFCARTLADVPKLVSSSAPRGARDATIMSPPTDDGARTTLGASFVAVHHMAVDACALPVSLLPPREAR